MIETDVTITEGEPDPDNNVDVGLAWIDGGWGTYFEGDYEQTHWRQHELTDWLVDRLDAPETVQAAIDDERVSVKQKEYTDPEIQGFRGLVARATYDEDNAEWTVKILTDN